MALGMFPHKHLLTLGLVLTTSTLLFGCGSEAAKIVGIDHAEADITYVNATDEMATFYLKRDKTFDNDDEDKLFRDKYEVARDIPTNNASNRIEHEFPYIENGIHLGVRESVTQNRRKLISKHIKDGNDLWAIAWEDGNDFELTLMKRKRANRDGEYRVRVFSNTRLPVYINGSTNATTTTEKGKATNHLSIFNCADSLTVGTFPIDLCSGDVGLTYIVVVDANGFRMMIQE